MTIAFIIFIFTLNTPKYNYIPDYININGISKTNLDANTKEKMNVRGNGVNYSIYNMLEQVYAVASDIGLNASGKIIVKNNGNKAFNVSFSYALSPQELQGRIRVTIIPKSILVPASEYKTVMVYIEILPGVAAGLYTLSIYLTFRTITNGGGSQILPSATVSTMIMVGEHSYKLTVVLLQPDRTPAIGYIRVYYLYSGSYILLYGQRASTFTFHVIEGKYLIEAIIGGRKASKEIDVNKDETVEIIISTIFVQSVEIIKKPADPRDSLIFRVEIVNADPLIYKKLILVKTVLKNGSGSIVSNATLAKLTIRRNVVKTILGFLSPSKPWRNGTYVIEIIIESNNKVFYNYTDELTFRVFYPERIIRIPEVPFIYLLLTVLMSIIFGFLGAKFALIRFRKRYIPKAVGLIHGKDIIAYDTYIKEFVIPEMISGEWNKIIYGFYVLSRRYWRRREELSPLIITLNTEKWVFHAITKDLAYFICIHSVFNEYDLQEFFEKLRRYFEDKINRYGLTTLFANPEETLGDLGEKIETFFK